MPQRSTLLIVLIAVYIGAELVSNVTAGRLVQFGPLVFPGAILLYSLTFTLRDAIHVAGGWTAAKALLWGGLAANALLAGYGLIVNALPTPDFFDDAAYQAVFGSTFRVVFASLLAYLLSTALDALIFERLRHRGVTTQVVASNAVSTTLDTIIFITVAFAGTGAPLLNLMLGQIILKMLISLLLIPLVRWVRTQVPSTPADLTAQP
ncbi:queuosine precursor transporter [Deinococcus radiophilus]|uniref:Probable queuosine precursor transporter n=2 Tax=Deinococcus radiophilus TaxID=32062 RepID=A0A431VU95_9DEIO|nr:queuosine precursor transporter [Deinococcus radiophilus]RTR26827.1 VUT family protein [Deinococcus radiophilus]